MFDTLATSGVSIISDGSSQPLVSVIIPAYNTAKTIERAIDSVLAQTYRRLQIIVVDDGSTDDLASALAKYDSYILVLKQQNKGVGAARNAGVDKSDGSLLAFLDADDLWHPRKLELQVSVFKQYPEIVLCWTEFDERRPEKLALEVRSVPIELKVTVSNDFDRIFPRPYFGTPGVMISRKTFIQLRGFREDIRSAEDIDLWLRAAYGKHVAKINFPLFEITRTPGSLTSVLMDGTYRDNLRVIEQFCKNHPEYASRRPGVVRSARARVLENWGSDALVRSDYRLAKSLFIESIKSKPSLRALLLLVKATIARRLFITGSSRHH